MRNPKQKKFTVHYKLDGLYTAEIPADSLKDALEKSQAMSQDELDKAPGECVDSEVKITAVFE